MDKFSLKKSHYRKSKLNHLTSDLKTSNQKKMKQNYLIIQPENSLMNTQLFSSLSPDIHHLYSVDRNTDATSVVKNTNYIYPSEVSEHPEHRSSFLRECVFTGSPEHPYTHPPPQSLRNCKLIPYKEPSGMTPPFLQ